jgi:hypothetical protein
MIFDLPTPQRKIPDNYKSRRKALRTIYDIDQRKVDDEVIHDSTKIDAVVRGKVGARTARQDRQN